MNNTGHNKGQAEALAILKTKGFVETNNTRIGLDMERIVNGMAEKVVVDLNGRVKMYMPTKPTNYQKQKLKQVSNINNEVGVK